MVTNSTLPTRHRSRDLIGGGFKEGSKCVLFTRENILKVDDLYSDQDEADTRLLLHTQHASLKHPRIIVQSPDTDVAVMCINMYSSM